MTINNFLTKILDEKYDLLDTKKNFYTMIREKLESTDYSSYSIFKQVISEDGKLNLIAEIKKASPSKGVIRENFDVLDIAKTYEACGAKALSILTEDKYFLGKPEFIKKVTDEIRLPILMKDFFISVDQIYEARYYGASAILLIMAVLDDDKVKQFLAVAKALDLDCLVEIHSEDELKRALDCGAEIIGVNNRDLKTFEVDLGVSEDLIPKIPKEIVTVAESGIGSHEHIQRLEKLDANAVLIGETFMREEDIGAKVRLVMSNEN